MKTQQMEMGLYLESNVATGEQRIVLDFKGMSRMYIRLEQAQTLIDGLNECLQIAEAKRNTSQ